MTSASIRARWALLFVVLALFFTSIVPVRSEDSHELSEDDGLMAGDDGLGGEDGADAGIEGPGEEFSEDQMQELMKKLGRGGEDGGGDPFGMGGRRYTRDIPAVEEDIPHILCQTCEELVNHMQERLTERRNRLKKTKVTELEILEMLETVCDPLQGDGEWITQFDIVERDDKLVLENKGQQGHCEEECKTMVQACDNIVKEGDSDIAELLYSSKPGAKDKICSKVIRKLKGACGQPAIPIRADRVVGGDNFKPKSDLDIALQEAGKELRHKQEINPDFLKDEM